MPKIFKQNKFALLGANILIILIWLTITSFLINLFKSENALAYKTFITQEMLKKGYLAATAVYVCTAHTKDIIDSYIENIRPIFQMIKECEDGRNIMDLLEGPIAHNGFKRLN